MRSILIFLLAITLTAIDAKDKTELIKVKGVVGEAYGTFDVSINSLIQKAVNDAKVKALQKGGLKENISVFNDMFQGDDGDIEEYFVSGVVTNVNGNITDVVVTDTTTKIKDQLQIVKVKVDATIIKYKTERDLGFKMEVEGMKNFYLNGEELKFDVKPSRDSYLSVFVVAGTDESYVLFPNDYEKSYLVNSGSAARFPSETMEYILETTKTMESHRLIVVATKKEIPYVKKVNYKNILEWIFTIPPDERTMSTHNFKVINKK